MSRKRFLAIVDPWKNAMSPDVEEFPYLESDLSIQCQLIHNQLPRLQPLFDDIIVVDSGITPNPLFDELHNIEGFIFGDPYYDQVTFKKFKYLEDKQDWDAWFCGFHYGKCIHGKINDIVKHYGWDYSRFNIIQNLSFMFPGDEKKRLIKWDCNIEIFKNVKEYNWDYVGKLTEL
jgi:hypothetical protein